MSFRFLILPIGPRRARLSAQCSRTSRSWIASAPSSRRRGALRTRAQQFWQELPGRRRRWTRLWTESSRPRIPPFKILLKNCESSLGLKTAIYQKASFSPAGDPRRKWRRATTSLPRRRGSTPSERRTESAATRFTTRTPKCWSRRLKATHLHTLKKFGVSVKCAYNCKKTENNRVTD